MTCLDERRLLEVHAGAGTAADRAHATTCDACARRLGALARDLARIDTVLRETAPPRGAREPLRAWRWAPVAVAAVLAIAVTLHRPAHTPVPPDDDTLALVDELASVWAQDVSPVDTTETETGTQASSTCIWGDPLLGVGCDEPADMQIAWR